MWKFIVKRMLAIIPIVLGAIFIIFALMSFAPGNAASMLLPEGASEEEVLALEDSLGLNDPLLVRYVNYIADLLKGDMGTSYKSGTPVWDELMVHIPYTLMLALSATIISILIAVPLGVLAAIRQNTIFDSCSMVFCLLGISMPQFWMGILLILCFSVNLGWLPVSGADSLAHLILPSIASSFVFLASIARVTRSSMLEVIRQDYIRTAKAKGVSKMTVISKHALKNALLPTITVVGLQIGSLISGAVVLETVFGWPGIGRFLVNSLSWRDTPCVLGCVVFLVIGISVINLIVDILYGFVDPRIKSAYKKA